MSKAQKHFEIEKLLVKLSRLQDELEIDLGIDYHKAHNRLAISLCKEVNNEYGNNQ